MDVTIEEYLDGFSKPQRAIITDEHPVKQVIAAAGSGKTRTIIGLVTYRLMRGLEEPGGVLMLTFSRKAAAEMRERLPGTLREAVEISTFHSFAYRWLTALHPELSLRRVSIIEEEAKRIFYSEHFRENADLIGGIPFAFLMNSPRIFQSLFPELYSLVTKAFDEFKKREGLLEYSDLIRILVQDLQRREAYLYALRTRYGLILVDEFQDTDPEQMKFLLEMNAPRIAVVGDDWQAIYSFRGATVEPFFNFRKSFKNVRVYRLSENYRSVSEIVKLGNRVIRSSSRQLKKRVVSARGKGERRCLCALPIFSGGEAELICHIPSECDYRILARSNFRCGVWRIAGIPEERIMTVHRAKGLEFDTIFLDLIGGWSGYDPSTESAGNDEEIRIAYVGLTRAKNRLIILYNPLADEEESEGALWKRLFSGRLKTVSTRTLFTG